MSVTSLMNVGSDVSVYWRTSLPVPARYTRAWPVAAPDTNSRLRLSTFMPVAAPPPCTSTDPWPVLRSPLKMPPASDRDPAKKSFPNPVAMPSGCHPFGSGIVSG